MNFNCVNKISKFIEDIFMIRGEYEKTQIHSENFILLLKCIDYFNSKKIDEEANEEMNIVPNYFGDGYYKSDDEEYDINDEISSATEEEEFEDIEELEYENEDKEIKNVSDDDNEVEEEKEIKEMINISDDDKDDSEAEEEDKEKVGKMLAISKILLGKAKKNKMIHTKIV